MSAEIDVSKVNGYAVVGSTLDREIVSKVYAVSDVGPLLSQTVVSKVVVYADLATVPPFSGRRRVNSSNSVGVFAYLGAP